LDSNPCENLSVLPANIPASRKELGLLDAIYFLRVNAKLCTIFETGLKLNFVGQDPPLWTSLAPPKGKEVPQLSKLPKVFLPPIVKKSKKEITFSGRNPER
jgi:hypothetical protein